MARIFITGSADGLGHLAAKELLGMGHQVVIHARNEERAKQAMEKLPGAEKVLVADLASMKETVLLASKANASGTFDAVIHNAGVYHVATSTINQDGLSLLLVVNTIAPYLLTCLMLQPKRLVYLSSGMHLQGDPRLDNLTRSNTDRSPSITYADTKLHDLILSKAVARKWKGVNANAVDPGWVPTKMGGPGAPGDLKKGYETQVWLAACTEPGVMEINGQYLHPKKPAHYLPGADDNTIQEKLLAFCENLTGVKFEHK